MQTVTTWEGAGTEDDPYRPEICDYDLSSYQVVDYSAPPDGSITVEFECDQSVMEAMVADGIEITS